MQKKYHLDYDFTNDSPMYKDTFLKQIGRRHCSQNETIRKHAHMDWFELTIAIDGEGIVTTNDKPKPISKGDIYLSFPGDFHEITSSGDAPLKYDYFSFSTENIVIKEELKRIVAETLSCDRRIFRDDMVSLAVSFVLSEITSDKKYRTDVISSALEQVLFLVIRNFAENKSENKKRNITAAEELCFQIMHYIDTHIYSITNLSDLSRVFHFNYNYLSRLFKRMTGKPIFDYYKSRRLDVAKLLILERKMNISQIAEILNYSSLYSFSKAFKNRFGISPTGYINSGDD